MQNGALRLLRHFRKVTRRHWSSSLMAGDVGVHSVPQGGGWCQVAVSHW